MRVSELIEKLQQMPQHLEVYSCCDHGQSPEKSQPPSITWTDEGGFLDSGWSNNKEEAIEEGFTQQFVIL